MPCAIIRFVNSEVDIEIASFSVHTADEVFVIDYIISMDVNANFTHQSQDIIIQRDGGVPLEKHSLLALSAMQTMAGRAIRDIKTGGKRETRNILKVCRSYANRPQQQGFWDLVKKFLTSPGNQYQALLHRAVCSVKEETLKTLMINLSCNAFSAGRDLLCKGAAENQEYRWIQWLTPASDIQAVIYDWNQKGVFVFLLNLCDYQDRPSLLAELPTHNNRCVFIYIVSNAEADLSWIEKSPCSDNICILMTPEVVDHYAPWLLQQKIFFGVIRDYHDIQTLQDEHARLTHWIDSGCLLGVYYTGQHPCSKFQEEDPYDTLKHIRRTGQLELFLCDLERDTDLVQDILLGRRTLLEHGSSSI